MHICALIRRCGVKCCISTENGMPLDQTDHPSHTTGKEVELPLKSHTSAGGFPQFVHLGIGIIGTIHVAIITLALNTGHLAPGRLNSRQIEL